MSMERLIDKLYIQLTKNDDEITHQLESVRQFISDNFGFIVKCQTVALLNRNGVLVDIVRPHCADEHIEAKQLPFILSQVERCAVRAVAITIPDNTPGKVEKDAESLCLALPLSTSKGLFGVVLTICENVAIKEEDIATLTTASKILSLSFNAYHSDLKLQVAEKELELSRNDTIRVLSGASEYRDNETGMHVTRVSRYAGAIAESTGLSDKECEVIIAAAPMHDVGKIGIPDNILLKKGKLTSSEYEIMKSHTLIGAKILSGSDKVMQAAREIALSHHEKWDGSGYPNGLVGKSIPRYGRICAIADVFDALTTTRPYKKEWPAEEAVEWITSQSGAHFDPVLVKAFKCALPRIMQIKELYRDDIIFPWEEIGHQPIMSNDFDWLQWKDSLSTGIDAIDIHHMHLFDIVNDLHDVVTKNKPIDKVATLVRSLVNYAQIHFRAEEKMMSHHNYCDYLTHKNKHREFEQKMDQFHTELRSRPLTARYDILDYLKSWLFRHIAIEDIKLKGLGAKHANVIEHQQL